MRNTITVYYCDICDKQVFGEDELFRYPIPMAKWQGKPHLTESVVCPSDVCKECHNRLVTAVGLCKQYPEKLDALVKETAKAKKR